MNTRNKAQWLADFYQKVADGGIMQARTAFTPWVDQEVGPNLESFSHGDWRIKPKPREWVIMGPSQHAEGPSIPIGHAVKVREVIE